MNYVGIINEMLQKGGNSKSVKDYITVERAGGEDHYPCFKATIDLDGIKKETRGFDTKKTLSQMVCRVWLEEKGLL